MSQEVSTVDNWPSLRRTISPSPDWPQADVVQLAQRETGLADKADKLEDAEKAVAAVQVGQNLACSMESLYTGSKLRI